MDFKQADQATGYNQDEIEQKLFIEFAPAFNFELNGPQLLVKALERGYVVKVGLLNIYEINENYEGVNNNA